MKKLALMFAISGFCNLAVATIIFSAGNLSWIILLASIFFGVWLIWISFGIWNRNIIAWKNVFAIIALACISFIPQVIFSLPQSSISSKILILTATAVSSILGGAGLSYIWYLKKPWFLYKKQ